MEFLEEGRWDYTEKNDLFYFFHEKGINHVTVNTNINYRKSAFAGQVLRIETKVIRRGNKSVTMEQKVFLKDSDTLIADAEIKNVFINDKKGNVIVIDEDIMNFWSDLKQV